MKNQDQENGIPSRPGIALRVIAAAAAFSVVSVSTAAGQVDASGTFVMPFRGLLSENCSLEVVQTGSDIELAQDCMLYYDGRAQGTVNTETGEFSAVGICDYFFEVEPAGQPLPPVYEISGTIAADGSIITGRFACLELLPFELSFVATKCGNGILDEREDCESGVCCSDGCKFDVGAFCNEDACSAGLCDASGSCFGNVPFAAGTHCEVDGDNCTDDWCDGEGACVAVATTVCDGCSACNETHECEPVARYLNNSGPGGCRTFPGTQFNDTSLLISNREGRERVKWSLRGGYIEEASQFGDPAADTGYQLCVFYRDLTTDPWRVAAMARAEPGVGWHRRPFGLRFADREATGGLSSVKLHASSTPRKSQVAAAGRGDGLIVTPDLDDVLVAAEGGFVQAELRADNGKCWGWVYSSRRFGSELKSSDGLLRVRRGR